MQAVQGYLVSLVDQKYAKTGLKTAALVGSLLFCINHGPALLRGEMNRERWASAALTYVMPYLVNVHGQYAYQRKLQRDRLF